jgi:hypothetical protein
MLPGGPVRPLEDDHERVISLTISILDGLGQLWPQEIARERFRPALADLFVVALAGRMLEQRSIITLTTTLFPAKIAKMAREGFAPDWVIHQGV